MGCSSSRGAAHGTTQRTAHRTCTPHGEARRTSHGTSHGTASGTYTSCGAVQGAEKGAAHGTFSTPMGHLAPHGLGLPTGLHAEHAQPLHSPWDVRHPIGQPMGLPTGHTQPMSQPLAQPMGLVPPTCVAQRMGRLPCQWVVQRSRINSYIQPPMGLPIGHA